MNKNEIIKEHLKNLRSDIVLNSLDLNDYENRYNIPRDDVYWFFNGFADYIEYYGKKDNIKNLIEWFYFCDGWIGYAHASVFWWSIYD